MNIATRAFPLSFAIGCLFLLAPACSSTPSSGLRSCFDTGSSVVCVQSAALSTARRDVNGDGTPDVFVCADDDDDGHDRDRDRDQTATMTTDTDEDHDGVEDRLDCGHRAECHELENPENRVGDDSMKTKTTDSTLKGGGGTGGAEAEHDGGHDATGGHDGNDGMDEHPRTGCTAPASS
jgi:hypothetical protein